MLLSQAVYTQTGGRLDLATSCSSTSPTLEGSPLACLSLSSPYRVWVWRAQGTRPPDLRIPFQDLCGPLPKISPSWGHHPAGIRTPVSVRGRSQGTVGQSLGTQAGVHKALHTCDEEGLEREVEGARSPHTGMGSKGSVNSEV